MRPSIPNEIVFRIGRHLESTKSSRTLSSLSQTSHSIHTLLSPLLYSNLDISQETLLIILNNPSAHFNQVKSLTLRDIWTNYNIDHTTSITSLSSSEVVFPNATTLRMKDKMETPLVFDPLPLLSSLSRLLRVERLFLDLHMISWRLGCLSSLWPHTLKVIEFRCRQWTLPFTIPGCHHIVHLSHRSPFLYNTASKWDQGRYGDGREGLDPDSDEYSVGSRTSMLTMVRWMVNSIQSTCMREDQEWEEARRVREREGDRNGESGEIVDTRLECETEKEIKRSTWEIRVAHGGRKELEWVERKVGEMLIMAGLGDGRVVVDEESGEITVDCFKIVVEDVSDV